MWELIIVTCFGPRESDWGSKPRCEERPIVRGVNTDKPESRCEYFLERKFRIGTADYVYCRERQVEKVQR